MHIREVYTVRPDYKGPRALQGRAPEKKKSIRKGKMNLIVKKIDT